MNGDQLQRYDDWLHRYIEREQLCSTMNNTKWRALIRVLDELQSVPIQFRTKCLGADPSMYWDTSFPEHVPYPLRSIKWLEINPVIRYRPAALLDEEVTDYTQKVIEALRSIHVPFTQEGSIIRVWGYVRSGTVLAAN